MAGYQIKLSVTDIEPMKSYVEEMNSVVSFLHSKPNLTALERKVIDSHQRFMGQLEESYDEFTEPYLKIVRKQETL